MCPATRLGYSLKPPDTVRGSACRPRPGCKIYDGNFSLTRCFRERGLLSGEGQTLLGCGVAFGLEGGEDLGVAPRRQVGQGHRDRSSGGLSLMAEYQWNLEGANEINNDLLRLQLAIDF